MGIDVFAYRLYRLRRLIAVAVAFPVLVVLAIAALKGPAAFVLLVLAVGAPLAHALRYPNAWTETLAVSFTMAVLLALAGTIGPGLGLVGLALRLGGLVLLGLVLLMAMGALLPRLLLGGPQQPVQARARRRSRLSPEALKAAITLYPGREDPRASCSDADEDGAFAVCIRPEMPALDPAARATAEIRLFAQVLTSTPERHEVMSVEDDGRAEAEDVDPGEEVEDAFGGAGPDQAAEAEPEITITRHDFVRLRRGTRVEVSERGAVMPRGLALGFWLQDYMADHLTDEIDRAEGRRPRANRAAPHEQLSVDLARPLTRRRTARHPAE
jgi:hypothetical protein